MASSKLWLCLIGSLVFSLADALAQESTELRGTDDSDVLAAKIDYHIENRWKQEEVVPAPAADDATYLRRTYLNIVGRIPRVSEVRAFLEDDSPDKRRQLVDRLLEEPGYVSHMANLWRSQMLPEADADIQVQVTLPSFERWLRARLAEGAQFDEIVRELITFPVSNARDQNGPGAFYIAKDAKPENLAAATSRLFLGVRLECAQCHDHPFAKWKKEEFWSFAAFYSGVSGEANAQLEDKVLEREIKIPETDTTVPARFLDGRQPIWGREFTTRQVLAAWLTSPDNKYFARSTANRVWSQFFGVGIVDPVDDFDESNPASHPEMLDEIATAFAEHNYDFKFLIRAITATRAYQLSSQHTDESQEVAQRFARMSVRSLSPEQLFDSLSFATGYYEQQVDNRLIFNNMSPRNQFRNLFLSNPFESTETQTSILQALALMNGSFVNTAADPGQSLTLAAVADAPFYDTAGRIETLYLATFGRQPSEEELAKLVKYVDGSIEEETGSTEATAKTGNQTQSAPDEAGKLLAGTRRSLPPETKRLGNVFWALLNSSEFILNH